MILEKYCSMAEEVLEKTAKKMDYKKVLSSYITRLIIAYSSSKMKIWKSPITLSSTSALSLWILTMTKKSSKPPGDSSGTPTEPPLKAFLDTTDSKSSTKEPSKEPLNSARNTTERTRPRSFSN